MEKIVLKKNRLTLCVLIEVKGKTYQVALDKKGQKKLTNILPQLFKDNIIKLFEEELPITISNPTH